MVLKRDLEIKLGALERSLYLEIFAKMLEKRDKEKNQLNQAILLDEQFKVLIEMDTDVEKNPLKHLVI